MHVYMFYESSKLTLVCLQVPFLSFYLVDSVFMYLAYLFLGIVDTQWMKAVTVGCSEIDGFHFPMISSSDAESISQNDLLLLSNKEVPGFC